MKKGFTLVELVDVIILLGAIALLIIPKLNNSLRNGKQEVYDSQIENIKMSLKNWITDNYIPKQNEYVMISLGQLKSLGYIDKEIINPKTKKYFDNNMILKVTNNNGNLVYDISNVDDTDVKYKELPKVTLNGNTVEFVEINTEYVDKGLIAKDKNNNNITNINIEFNPNFDKTNIGTYVQKYSINDKNYLNFYRTIIVRDTIGPTISFNNNLSMTYDQSISYNFKSDVVVNDNSGKPVTINVSNNITPLKGLYSIKYEAIDFVGNKTVKYRDITIR